MRFAPFLLLFVIFIAAMHSDLNAGQAFNHCDDAQSTADEMGCVKRRYDDAQERLNAIFQEVMQEQDQNKDKAQAVRSAQNDWISYRDKECIWETDQVETESLRRLEELSCLTILTEQRAELLEETFGEQQEKEIKEYSAFPRWMNVVADENPGIFWRYGNRLSVDLDCDGQEEEIMVGQEIQRNNTPSEGVSPYTVKTVLVAAKNPVAGKPQARLLQVNLLSDQKDGHLCNPNVKLSVIDYPDITKTAISTDENDTDQKEQPQCAQALKIQSGGCFPLILLWNEGDYKFQSVEEKNL